jgi:hypothetical protein
MNERRGTPEENDYVDISAEHDGRGRAEFVHPGDPDIDDEESLDSDLFSGADNDFDTDEDIDTLEIDDPEVTADDLDTEDLHHTETVTELEQ